MSEYSTEIPVGLCQCGCGQRTTIATHTITKWGHVRGQPHRFCRGHHIGTKKVRPVSERFWEKVDRREPNECWLWQASISGGYGRFGITDRGILAHRVAWELTHGPIPEKFQVLHKCDQPNCVNPSHLFLGTQEDNIRDMTRKGRQWTKLTDTQAGEIRELYRHGELSMAKIAKLYSVCSASIHSIIHGKTHVT